MTPMALEGRNPCIHLQGVCVDERSCYEVCLHDEAELADMDLNACVYTDYKSGQMM